RGAPPADPVEWPAFLATLADAADTLVDIARTLTAERRDSERSDVLGWSQAARATIASHQRDLETLMPWANLASGPTAAAVTARASLSSSPAPPVLADHCQTAIAEITALRDTAGHEDERMDALIGALQRSAAAAGALVRRLLAAPTTARLL